MPNQITKPNSAKRRRIIRHILLIAKQLQNKSVLEVTKPEIQTQASQIILKAAAFAIPKGLPESMFELIKPEDLYQVESDCTNMPSGEDAFFIAPVETMSQYIVTNAFGVTDGVSGCWNSGVDPSLIARAIASRCKKIVSSTTEVISAFDLLGEAISKIRYDKEVRRGCTTAIVATLDGTKLSIANMGDCGLLVFRPEIVDKTVFKQFFMAPKKMETFDMPCQIDIAYWNYSCYDPDVFVVQLMENDIIVCGSDCLFDNLFVEEMVKIIENISVNYKEEEFVARCAKTLAHQSRKILYDGTIDTPIARQYDDFQGAKLDDITVIVCKVGRR